MQKRPLNPALQRPIMYIMFGRIMSIFEVGTNYFCDAGSGFVLHVIERGNSLLRFCILDLSAVNAFGFSAMHHPIILGVELSAISECEFVETLVNRHWLTFFASERCKAFTLADFRDNFVNYKPF